MKINQFSRQGKRTNNEDSLGMSLGLLTVCDGMGGHSYGERASAFVKEAMLKAFAEPKPLGKMEIQQQLNQVQTDLNQLLDKEPELEKMGTTFTGIFITPDVWYAAHIGDSRIYLFRPSEQKLWHTWDHSLVGELMRTKEITVEAGRFHPMSNRISKAIMAQKEGKLANASIVRIDELKKGDILLLCSDGVVEGWGDWELVKLFSDESLGFEQKCKKLAEQCNEKSKDNNTAIIVEIEETEAFSFGTNDELDWKTFAEVEADYKQYVKDNEEEMEEPKEEKPLPPKETPKAEPEKSVPVSQEPKAPMGNMKGERPVVHGAPTRNKQTSKLSILLVALAVAALALFFILRGRKPSDEETEFAKCKNVKDYREYVSHYGSKGKHYQEAMQFIENHVKDSIQEAKDKAKAEAERKAEEEAKRMEKEAKEREEAAYKACTTIEACEQYLKEYPQGRYVSAVQQKKSELKKAEEERKRKEKLQQSLQSQSEPESQTDNEPENKTENATETL